MPVDKQYFARWPRIYWGVQYDREQLVDFQADPHSPKGSQLLRLGYISEADARRVLPTCGVCGAQFSGEMWRDAHGDEHHAGRTRQGLEVQSIPNSLAYEDKTGDAEERQLMREVPLALEKTEASLKG